MYSPQRNQNEQQRSGYICRTLHEPLLEPKLLKNCHFPDQVFLHIFLDAVFVCPHRESFPEMKVGLGNAPALPTTAGPTPTSPIRSNTADMQGPRSPHSPTWSAKVSDGLAYVQCFS
jgi:hypothetical protein